MKCNDEYEVGDKVFLSPETSWNTSDIMNPLNTIGTIKSFDDAWVFVDWTNTEEGLGNCYKRFRYDFIPVEEEVIFNLFIGDEE